MQSPLSIITIGKPGGCKSTANAYILYDFQRTGLTPQFVSDRLLLEEAVVHDIMLSGKKNQDGSWEGDHGILFDGDKPPGRKVFQIKDSILLNRIHDQMIELSVTHHVPHGVIFEFATGADKDLGEGGILLQSGESIITRFRENPVRDERRVIVVEIDASLDERMRRNGERVDGMLPETFRAFFGDGGELRESGDTLRQFGVDYHWINNDYNDLGRFIRTLEEFRAEYIRPLLEGNFPGREGFVPPLFPGKEL